jgi:hypothetical protein
MRWRRLALVLAAGAFLVISGVMRSGEAQIPPGVSLPPGVTFPSIPSIPTTSPPPTMPPETTTSTGPPPTMPPSSTTTSGPPPTMPPTTEPGVGDILDQEIQDVIDRLEQFGEEFAGLIETLQNLQNRF